LVACLTLAVLVDPVVVAASVALVLVGLLWHAAARRQRG
jgi:hypothetical protein